MQSVFSLVLQKLFPLYFLIGLGYWAGKRLEVKRESVASLLIYILAPGVVFQSLISTPLDLHRLSLPLFFFVVCSLMCGLTLVIGGRIWGNASVKNIAAFSSASGNTGYFGLPVAAFLFGSSALGVVVLCIFGFILFESTVGFFVTARGTYSPRESLRRVFRVPTIYAFILAVVLNAAGIRWSAVSGDFGQLFRGAYSFLGMMMIGLGVANLREWKVDWNYIKVTFGMKFVVWPLLIFTFLWFDRTRLHIYDPLSHQVMALMAIVPLPANSVALATELRVEPEKAGVAVLLSTVVALIVIPILTQFR